MAVGWGWDPPGTLGLVHEGIKTGSQLGKGMCLWQS